MEITATFGLASGRKMAQLTQKMKSRKTFLSQDYAMNRNSVETLYHYTLDIVFVLLTAKTYCCCHM